MRVIIMRCSSEKYWYKDRVGKTVDVVEHDELNYKLADNKSINKLLSKKDCAVI